MPPIALLLLLLAAGAAALLAARREQNAAARPSGSGPRVVAALGDSLTAGGRYARMLSALLPAGSRTYVFGFGGRGTRVIGDHLGAALAVHPTDVVILAGVNDVGSNRKAEYVVTRLAQMYGRVRAVGVRPIAVLLTPWRGHHVATDATALETARVNAWIRSAGVRYVDTTALGDSLGRIRQEYDSGDGLHLNSRGQAVLGRMIYDQAFGPA